VHHERRAALPVVSSNRFDGFQGPEVDDVAQLDEAALAYAQRQPSDLLIVGAERFWHPDHDAVSTVALYHGADDLPGERGSDRLVHFAGLEAVTLERVALHVDLE